MEKDILFKIKKHKEWCDSCNNKEQKGEQLCLVGRIIEGGEWENIDVSCAKIIDCTFRNTVLDNWDFYANILCYTRFEETEIVSSQFVKANLENTQFFNTTIKNVNFNKADFCGSSFTNVRIENCRLIYCTFADIYLENVSFKGVDFEGAYIHNAIFDDKTVLENVSGLERAYVININIGSIENPIYLKEKEALQWLIDKCI